MQDCGILGWFVLLLLVLFADSHCPRCSLVRYLLHTLLTVHVTSVLRVGVGSVVCAVAAVAGVWVLAVKAVAAVAMFWL